MDTSLIRTCWIIRHIHTYSTHNNTYDIRIKNTAIIPHPGFLLMRWRVLSQNDILLVIITQSHACKTTRINCLWYRYYFWCCYQYTSHDESVSIGSADVLGCPSCSQIHPLIFHPDIISFATLLPFTGCRKQISRPRESPGVHQLYPAPIHTRPTELHPGPVWAAALAHSDEKSKLWIYGSGTPISYQSTQQFVVERIMRYC